MGNCPLSDYHYGKLSPRAQGWGLPMKITRAKNGQNLMEYVLIMCIVLIAVLSTGFIGKLRSSADKYFSKSVSAVPGIEKVGGK